MPVEDKPMINTPVQKNTDALIAHQPKSDSPEDKRIVGLIKQELESTDWAKKTFADVHSILVSYYRDALGHLDGDPGYIHDRTQGVLSEIAGRTNSKIVYGEDNLGLVESKSPVFLVTNHLGAYKLANIRPKEDLGLDNGLESMHALPLFFGALKPVADRLEDFLYIAAFEFPGEIGLLQEPSGWVTVPLDGKGRTGELHEATQEMIRKHRNSALTVLPEGGTSGKRSDGGPYDLEPFRKGAFVIAGDLKIPILPVVQYFDPNTGFELAVLPPFTPQAPSDSRESFGYYEGVAKKTQQEMQAWLNTRKAA